MDHYVQINVITWAAARGQVMQTTSLLGGSEY